ncbi:MAG: prepilin peptidase [bacterium]
MFPILTFIFFTFGLLIGSFLNVVILRFNTHKSLGGRSACMVCLNKLSWFELIPLFSFLGLKGRCRSCQTKISAQYPLVEFVSGLIFAGLFWKFKDLFFVPDFTFALVYVYYAFMFSILLVIAVYDLKHKIIPDSLAFVFGSLAFLGLFFFNHDITNSVTALCLYPHIPTVLDVCSGLFIAAPFAFFWLVSSGRWMGLGDAKLSIGIGWLLGTMTAFTGLVLAFWSGALVGIFLILISKLHGGRGGYKMKSEIPFAPFIVFGAIVAFLFGLNFFLI